MRFTRANVHDEDVNMSYASHIIIAFICIVFLLVPHHRSFAARGWAPPHLQRGCRRLITVRIRSHD
eukprot:12930821-Prorocentrum_lima.AAC.1